MDSRARFETVSFFSATGHFQEAKALAEQLYGDPTSDAYQSKTAKQWVEYLDNALKRDSTIAARLFGPTEQRSSLNGEFLPLYKVAPVYPKVARPGRHAERAQQDHVRAAALE